MCASKKTSQRPDRPEIPFITCLIGILLAIFCLAVMSFAFYVIIYWEKFPIGVVVAMYGILPSMFWGLVSLLKRYGPSG